MVKPEVSYDRLDGGCSCQVIILSGISGDHYLYYRLGNDATLPCDIPPSETSCPSYNWLYNRNSDSPTTGKVDDGKVIKNSPGGARLSVSRNCHLIISNIIAEDAGRYICRIGVTDEFDTSVHLNILTISPSPPDADPNRDEEVKLTCSLLRYSGLRPCPQNSIRWVDENGTVLLGEGVGYKFNGQTDCVSHLTVKRQSGHNRRYTCQFFQANRVKIDAHYTPFFTDPTSSNTNDNTLTIIIVGAVVGMLVVLVVIAAVLIKYRRRAKVTEDVQKPTQSQDEPGGNLTYITVNHANQRGNPKKKVKAEEAVTYSTVKTTMKTEADSDPSSVYSSVR